MPHGVAGQGWLHIMQGDAATACPGVLGPVRSVGCMGPNLPPDLPPRGARGPGPAATAHDPA